MQEWGNKENNSRLRENWWSWTRSDGKFQNTLEVLTPQKGSKRRVDSRGRKHGGSKGK